MSDLAIREQAPARLETRQVEFIAGTEFVPKAYRGNVPAIMACIATGRELGIGDMESLRSIYVVDGKPTLSSELLVKLIRRRGHSIRGDFNAETVTAKGKRGDNGDEMTVTWTMAMAERAGLAKKDNWRKYPEAMLWARAASQLARMLFPDVLAGVSYTPDEAEMTDEDKILEATAVTIPAGPPIDDSEPEPQGPQGGAQPPAPSSEPIAGEAQSGSEQTSFADRIPASAKNRETGE